MTSSLAEPQFINSQNVSTDIPLSELSHSQSNSLDPGNQGTVDQNALNSIELSKSLLPSLSPISSINNAPTHIRLFDATHPEIPTTYLALSDPEPFSLQSFSELVYEHNLSKIDIQDGTTVSRALIIGRVRTLDSNERIHFSHYDAWALNEVIFYRHKRHKPMDMRSGCVDPYTQRKIMDVDYFMVCPNTTNIESVSPPARYSVAFNNDQGMPLELGIPHPKLLSAWLPLKSPSDSIQRLPEIHPEISPSFSTDTPPAPPYLDALHISTAVNYSRSLTLQYTFRLNALPSDTTSSIKSTHPSPTMIAIRDEPSPHALRIMQIRRDFWRFRSGFPSWCVRRRIYLLVGIPLILVIVYTAIFLAKKRL